MAACIGLLATTVLHADIVLEGEQHIGDDTGVADAVLIPDDNVRRLQHLANPSHFELTSETVITGVRFDNLRSLDGEIRVRIDNIDPSGTFVASSNSFVFDSPMPPLPPGVHTIAVDPGCADANLNPGVFGIVVCNEDDIGWSSLTLISDATTTSINLNQRRHIGDFSDETDQYGGDYYPDVAEAEIIEYSIVLDRPRQVSQLATYNMRDVDRIDVFVNGNNIGNFQGNDFDSYPLLTIPDNRVLPVGTHTLRLETIDESGNADDASWDDLILSFSNTTATLPFAFNAVDLGQPANGVVTTKLADEKFQLDVHALAEDGSGATDYDGTVQVDLLDARDDSGGLDIYGCRSSWTFVEKLKDVSFNTQAVKSTGDIEYKQALRVARIRITDSNLGLSVCSTDAFAVRPTQLNAAATDATDSTPGTARNVNNTAAPPTAGTTHRAGQPFTLTITPQDNAGDALSGLDIDPDLSVAAIAPATVSGVLSPGTWSTVGVQRVTNAALYSEVGAFDLTVDYTKFSDVDIADTPLAARQLLTTIGVGRFIPNQFAVAQNTPLFTPGCVNHTYLGQSFGFATPPQLTLTAQNAQGGTTTNYTGAPPSGLFQLDNGSASAPAFSTDLGVLTVNSPSVLVTDIGSGQAVVQVSAAGFTLARGAPVIAFDPAIAIATSIVDNDGVAALANPQQVGQATPGNGIGFSGGNGEFRHGLLSMDNAYGSPLLDLDVPLQLRYWADLGGGQSGYTLDTAGDCIPAIVTAGTVNPDQSAMAGGTTTANTPTFSAGTGFIRLDAPGSTATGYVTVDLDLPAGNAWLLDGANPSARASFGLKRQPDQLIHYREVIR